MKRQLVTPLFLSAIALAVSSAHAQRARGIDVSAWQGGSINWTSVRNSGVQFAFIRSSRGGTTGFYNQSDPNNNLGQNTQSQRYDDPYFERNINGAAANNILAGPYHFMRADILTYVNSSGQTVTHTGLDEANHFLEKAGMYMRPGYLRPVMDIEAGGSERSRTSLSDFSMAFSDRIYEVTGVRPIAYAGTYYANDELDSRLAIHDLWMPRYVTSVDPQTAVDIPAASGRPNVYGLWNPAYPTIPATRPWDFWQYTSSGSTPGIPGNVDQNVANGDIDWVRENFVIPAVWLVDSSGEWNTAANWNGVTVLPTPNDRVIINRTTGVYNITLSSGTHSIRSLQLNEPLAINGGSLTIAQYANLANLVTVNDGSLTSASIHHTTTLTLNGGTITTGSVTGNGILLAYGGDLHADSVRFGTVMLDGGNIHLTSSQTSVVTSINHTSSGSIDLGSAKLVVNYIGATPLDSIRLLIGQGYASGAWTGEGLRSDQLSTSTAIAYVEASRAVSPTGGSWGGISVDGTAILIAKALKGDTDLSGSVDFDDLLALAQAYDAGGTWIDGDTNYDGLINFDDLLSVAQNYGATLLADGSITADAGANFAADWALAQSIVPEPSLLALIPLLVVRRRR